MSLKSIWFRRAACQRPKHVIVESKLSDDSGSGRLRIESLESTLRMTTFTQNHVKIWKEIPKLPAYKTSEEV